jgi:hypothetical protein
LRTALETFIRGEENGMPRAARLCESLWDIAMKADSASDRLAAAKLIFERIDGKAVEIKESRSLKIEGIVYIPEPEDGMEAE